VAIASAGTDLLPQCRRGPCIPDLNPRRPSGGGRSRSP
jgi:hypothetical protein